MTGLTYAYWVNQTDARIQFWIDRGKELRELNKTLFHQLEANWQAIEATAGTELTWDPMPNARSAKIVRELPGSPGYASDTDAWDEQMPKMVEAWELFHQALDPFVRRLDFSAE